MAEQNANQETFDKIKAFLDESGGKITAGASDAAAQAKQFFEENKGKIEEALKSDKAEEISDNVLNTLSDFAKKIFGEENSAQIDDVRNKLDDSLGNQ